MEYTKDMVYNIQYGEAKDKPKKRKVITNKFVTVILTMVGILTILDFVLIFNFTNLLIH